MTINIFNILIFIAVIYGLTLSTILIFRKSHIQYSNRLLASFIIMISNYLLWVFIIDTGFNEYFLPVLYLPLNLVLGIGPLFYFYVKTLALNTFSFSRKDALHFIPLGLELIIHILISIESISSNIQTYETMYYYRIGPVIQFSGIISLLTYSFLSYKLSAGLNSDIKKRWIQRIVFFFSLLWLLWLVFTIIDIIFFNFKLGINDYYPLYIFIASFVSWMMIENIFYPDIYMQKVQKKKYDENTRTTIRNFKTLMNDQKLYLNPELSIVDLAGKLGVHPNYLSKLLNNYYKERFNSIINRYRINHFKLISKNKNYQNYSIFGLATESGFKSKSSFNRIFKEVTGMNPSSFIEKNRS